MKIDTDAAAAGAAAATAAASPAASAACIYFEILASRGALRAPVEVLDQIHAAAAAAEAAAVAAAAPAAAAFVSELKEFDPK